MQDARRDMPKYGTAAGKQERMDITGSGSIPAVSTEDSKPNFRRPSYPCMHGIATLECAMYF